MHRIRSGDAEIAYQMLGSGPPVLLLHPFPAHHELWLPAAQTVASRYRLILPDLRGHGESEVGDGPATMAKHAADLVRVLDAAEVGRVIVAGVSIGGYVLFELWRRYPERIAAVILSNTRAQADTPEGRQGRLQAAADVLERGTGPFLDGAVPKLIGRTTLATRPDLVDAARSMMRRMYPEGLSQVQRGMAERPDSVETLKTISVPALIIAGEEDMLSSLADAELMRQNIAGSQLKVIPSAGHYAIWERPQEVGALLRQFLELVVG